jgi:hypothetical protein
MFRKYGAVNVLGRFGAEMLGNLGLAASWRAKLRQGDDTFETRARPLRKSIFVAFNSFWRRELQPKSGSVSGGKSPATKMQEIAYQFFLLSAFVRKPLITNTFE